MVYRCTNRTWYDVDLGLGIRYPLLSWSTGSFIAGHAFGFTVIIWHLYSAPSHKKKLKGVLYLSWEAFEIECEMKVERERGREKDGEKEG